MLVWYNLNQLPHHYIDLFRLRALYVRIKPLIQSQFLTGQINPKGGNFERDDFILFLPSPDFSLKTHFSFFNQPILSQTRERL